MDMSETIAADSTQINAVDLAIPVTVTITGSSAGPDAKQPVNLEVAEFPGRVYRPCKSMRRLIVEAWGKDTKAYVGRQITLYNEKSVKFGSSNTGGIRIKALTHIDQSFSSTQMESQRKYVTYTIEKLPDPITAADADAIRDRITKADTLDALESIAAELKALNLGAHKKPLQTAWSERQTAIKAAS
ncbi:hypothetical protein A5731_00545 [Mycolicibacterium conceptionense]|nr:hypothetical protein A5718_29935 [Mycolicibacterium conceptionense]OBF09231.1 hypothetical protein A5731_00545 [Mycolicibacterium conceptionense]